jgi:hypothetical protein
VKDHIHPVPVVIFMPGKDLDVIVANCLGQVFFFDFQLVAVIDILGGAPSTLAKVRTPRFRHFNPE